MSDSDRATTPSVSERACFEAGIKFGSLYHQFADTPISPDSADSLAAAMEGSIENQPHCVDVTVEVDEERLAADIADSTASYTELTGTYLDVEIVVNLEGTEVVATMQLEDGYPLMAVESVRSGDR
jgi:hypothetical protein